MPLLISKVFWISATFINVLLTAIASILPLVPMTPFIILSIICIKNASPKLHKLIVENTLTQKICEKMPFMKKIIY